MTAPHVGVAGKTKKIQLVAEWGVSPIFLGLVL